MNNGDLISVIVPVFNVAPYLNKCIASVASQTYRNLQIILVDDGSTDESGEICDSFAGCDERIKVIHKENAGCDSARKAGMRVADGKYVAYLDGDDWIEPDMYETLLCYAKKYDVCVVESGVFLGDSKEKKRLPFLPEGMYAGARFDKVVAPRLVFSGRFFRHGVSPYLFSKLFRHDVVYNYQMSEATDTMLADDFLVALPAIAKTRSLYVSDACFYHYSTRWGSNKRASDFRLLDVIGNNFWRWVSMFPSGYERQMVYTILYFLIWKTPESLDAGKELCLIPYGGIRRGSRVVLYGAGAVGCILERYIRQSGCLELIAWVDRDFADLQCTGKNIVSPGEITSLDGFDYIVIAVLIAGVHEQIKHDLLDLGVDNEKIRTVSPDCSTDPVGFIKKIDCRELSEITRHEWC